MKNLKTTLALLLLIFIFNTIGTLHAQGTKIIDKGVSGLWMWKGTGQAFQNSKTKPSGALFILEHKSGLLSGQSMLSFPVNSQAFSGMSKQVKSAIYQFPLEGKKITDDKGRPAISFKVFGNDGVTYNESEAYLSEDGQTLTGKSTAVLLGENGQKINYNYTWVGKRS